ncbi:MAG: hypothetical protein ACK5LY_02595 [Lachnospirales bacterium]
MGKITLDLNKIINYIFILIIIIAFVSAISVFLNKSNEEDTSIIEDSINSALMQCYSLEGAYPADIYHLEEYGLWFNDERYHYYYEYFDGGIMPVVTVIAKKTSSEDDGDDVFVY